MSISTKLKAQDVAPAAPVLTLEGHPPVLAFTTLAGLFYVFNFGDRERICHETNLLLRRAP